MIDVLAGYVLWAIFITCFTLLAALGLSIVVRFLAALWRLPR